MSYCAAGSRERAEKDRMVQQRRRNAISVIDRHQWLAAVAAFANPVLVLAPMAAGAVQLRMLSEMAAAYNAPALIRVRRECRSADGPDPVEARRRRSRGKT